MHPRRRLRPPRRNGPNCKKTNTRWPAVSAPEDFPPYAWETTLSKPFDAIVGKILPSIGAPLPPGLNMNGSFEGKNFWGIEFDDRFAVMKCAGLIPEQHNYSIVLKNNQATVTIQSTTKPVVLAVKLDGTLVGTGYITEKEFERDFARLDETNFLTPSPILWAAWGRRAGA